MAELILYVVLGALLGIIYSLKRIYVLERKIDNIDAKLITTLIRKKKR